MENNLANDISIDKGVNIKEKKKASTFFNVISSTIAGVIIFVCSIYSTQLFAQNLGPYEFGLYSISRRFIATIYVIFSAGLTISITRYIALNKNDKKKQASFTRLALIFIICSACITIICLSIWNSFLSELFLGQKELSHILLACNYLILAYALTSLLGAIYRGYNSILKANITLVLCFGIIPVIIGLFFSKDNSVVNVLKLLGLSTLTVAIIPFLIISINSFKLIIGYKLKEDFKHFKELLKYGLPRVPADFAGALHLIAGPYLALRLGNIEAAGFFSVGQNLLRTVDICSAGVGFVFLPKIAGLLANKETEKIIHWVKILLSFSVQIGLYISLHFYLFIDKITILWLGDAYDKAIPIMQIIIIVVGFYLIIVNLRNVIDAIEHKPVNPINQIIGTSVTLVLSGIVFFVFKDIILLAWSFSLGYICIAMLIIIHLHKKYTISTKIYMFKYLIPINLIIISISYFFKIFLFNHIVYLIIIELLIFSLYIFLLNLIKVEWIKNFKLIYYD